MIKTLLALFLLSSVSHAALSKDSLPPTSFPLPETYCDALIRYPTASGWNLKEQLKYSKECFPTNFLLEFSQGTFFWGTD